MTRDEIMELANGTAGFHWMDEAHIQRFAALVAAAEREACAKVCDAKAKETFSAQCQVWGDYFAAAIRARETK